MYQLFNRDKHGRQPWLEVSELIFNKMLMNEHKEVT